MTESMLVHPVNFEHKKRHCGCVHTFLRFFSKLVDNMSSLWIDHQLLFKLLVSV